MVKTMRVNHSQKRDAVYTALRATAAHPTAEAVWQDVRKTHPSVSLATVYRNLKQFCAEGKALSLGDIAGQERFDGTVSPHSHMVCTRCGKIIDIEETFADRQALQALCERYDVAVSSCSVLLYGLCSVCKAESMESEHPRAL